ncbi:heme-binding protein [Phormidium sp. FACHB-1136]|uniref:heme-binding protein n=1 Tax=Phormidium sp. FACHB-1136 TaxID=2692848 RepID=UPI001687AAB7|nr:heme-binding protein [Phormidium sp. FACHB-1136]MBD2425371.1 heme-binding protein [Phormidium sp. FACHB-1136]
MKLSQGLLVLGVIALGVTVLALGVRSAASAPLPDGFPAPSPEGQIEVKHYPPYRAATVQMTGDLEDAPSRGFSPLFRHISSNDISMTAPVETRYPVATLEGQTTEGEAAVSFLYRNLDIVPSEVAQNIVVEDISAMTVVSIGTRGRYDIASYSTSLQQLQAWLAAHPEYEAIGQPRRFFYDGPFLPDIVKRSDVQIPVQVIDRTATGG